MSPDPSWSYKSKKSRSISTSVLRRLQNRAIQVSSMLICMSSISSSEYVPAPATTSFLTSFQLSKHRIKLRYSSKSSRPLPSTSIRSTKLNTNSWASGLVGTTPSRLLNTFNSWGTLIASRTQYFRNNSRYRSTVSAASPADSRNFFSRRSRRICISFTNSSKLASAAPSLVSVVRSSTSTQLSASPSSKSMKPSSRIFTWLAVRVS
mmetsp:Transcript_33915/g.88313  ORF Transcript_33915/g.88313 Transcript_33915/m.88313 type:complete len:207 (-) Transcript_33915:362-982(-)